MGKHKRRANWQRYPASPGTCETNSSTAVTGSLTHSGLEGATIQQLQRLFSRVVIDGNRTETELANGNLTGRVCVIPDGKVRIRFNDSTQQGVFRTMFHLYCLLASPNDQVALRVATDNIPGYLDAVTGGIALVPVNKLDLRNGNVYSIDFSEDLPSNARIED